MKKNSKETIFEKENRKPEDLSPLAKDKTNKLNNDQIKKLRFIRKTSRFLDYIVLVLSILALLVGVYAFWDTHEVMELASTEEYESYKPNRRDRYSFEDLKKLNKDVIGWIDVYGTKIDYPIVQGKDNQEYLNTTVFGEFSTAGSIFLDHENNKDFSDFQNILYGHYMAERKMFGDMEFFKSQEFFNTHRYGAIHIDGKKTRGLEFFAFLKTVGTDTEILSPAKNIDEKPDLIDHIYKESDYKRDLDFSDKENLVILDTCDLSITNGRYILVGRLTDKVEENIYKEDKKENRFANLISKTYKLNLLLILLILWILLVLIYLIYEGISRKKKREESKQNAQ